MSAGVPGNSPKNLLVVRLGAMGDIVHTMHAVTLLRKALPETQIGWLIEERWAELLCANGTPQSGTRSASRPLVDVVHSVNTKAWRKSPFSRATRQQFSAALKQIRDQRYEIAIDFQGAIKSALLVRLSGAGKVVGMDRPRESPARLLYSQRLQTTGSHVVEQYCSVADGVLQDFSGRGSLDRAGPGGPLSTKVPASLEFPFDEKAGRAISCKLQNVSGPIVLINPGAGWGAKQWPAERYGQVARALAQEVDAVLVNYGPGEEALAQEVRHASDGVAQPVTCSLSELIALTRRTSLFIGGDTGPLHLAAALGVPVVAIFGPTDPARTGPYGERSLVIRSNASRTSLSHTSAPDPGLLQVTSEQVLAAARQMMELKRV